MKYRLVELLRCVTCHGGLDATAAETRPVPSRANAVFTCREYCGRDRSRTIPAPARCAECAGMDIVAGTLTCRQCGEEFRIVQSVPWLYELENGPSKDVLSDTSGLYSHLWMDLIHAAPVGAVHEGRHLEAVEEALGESVVQGTIGLDAGSGSGSDTAAIAGRHPAVEVISLDISEGVYATKQRTATLPNVHVVRGSVLAIPLKSGICDFGYSFGVLHHTSDPPGGLKEIVRVLKPGGRASIYVYEDHDGNPWKALPLRLVAAIRRVTTRLNPRTLSGLCYLLSPFVVVAFSIPAQIMRRFKASRAFADRMPFNFGTSLFSVHDDLVDRFGAPIEARYNRAQVVALLESGRLAAVRTTKLRTAAGWVAKGIKMENGRAAGEAGDLESGASLLVGKGVVHEPSR